MLKTDKGFIRRASEPLGQDEIVKAVDITNASKHFELKLEKLGPYKLNYFRNGRYLLLGGRRGHVAAFDWVTKDLLCEFNVRESIHAVQWLHMPSMFAVGQKEWVHIYDRDGVELNVIKTMYRITHLDFLEYHFLLASASDKGYVSWKDISIGKDIASFPTKNKTTDLTHNPQNGLLFCSHPNGTMSMWSPNNNRPVVSMLCHGASVSSVTVTRCGNYFATSCVDNKVKIWDLRNYKCLLEHKTTYVPSKVRFSQLGLLAVTGGSTVTVYKNAFRPDKGLTPYVRHHVDHLIDDAGFCGYEDILGVGHQGGFTSLLVPGSGEPNFDSLEANPFMTKAQKREMEVKMLMDKVSYKMICLDPNELAKTNREQSTSSKK